MLHCTCQLPAMRAQLARRVVLVGMWHSIRHEQTTIRPAGWLPSDWSCLLPMCHVPVMSRLHLVGHEVRGTCCRLSLRVHPGYPAQVAHWQQSCRKHTLPPSGTLFTVHKLYRWSACLNVGPLAAVASRDALLAGAGDTYWVDTRGCLHLKLTDQGDPWRYTSWFDRDGMRAEEAVRWSSLRYEITTSGPAMECSDEFFCSLPV